MSTIVPNSKNPLSLSQQACPDPDAFERANYMKALKTYTSEFA